ncbi:MAG: type 1 glutamine amidotransferase [Gammaproteobacteria bacterium]|nr:type 1 glutamine amidotransferase [Gammaproteobacteria bacterium]
MRAHWLQHVPFEGLGSIDPWLSERGWSLTGSRLYVGDPLPEPRSCDLIIVMGGPMGVDDEARYPWLVREKQFVAEVLGAGVPMLGICLGAQLIAHAAGAAVYPNPEPEIGWWPVYAAPPEDSDCLSLPSVFEAFHWHGDTFDLPRNARLLASSPACRHQAFQLGSRVLGLQFHLETTAGSQADLVDNCRDDLARGGSWIQQEAALRGDPPERYARSNALMGDVLEWLTRS